MDLKKRLTFAILVGISVSLSDVAFHYFLPVDPMETFGYFLAKGIFAFIIALFLTNFDSILSILAGSIVFTTMMSIWYYFAYLMYDPALSSCVLPPTYNCTIPGVSQAVYFTLGGYPIEAISLIEFLTHLTLFFLFYILWRKVLSD